jgi:hypothetical protein
MQQGSALHAVAGCSLPSFVFEKHRSDKVPCHANFLGNTNTDGLSLCENAIISRRFINKLALRPSAIERVNMTRNEWFLFIVRRAGKRTIGVLLMFRLIGISIYG